MEDHPEIEISPHGGSQRRRFSSGQSRGEVCAWVQPVLVQQEYRRQAKQHRGLIRAYLGRVTELSLPQLTRLIRQYRESGQIQVTARPPAAVPQGRVPGAHRRQRANKIKSVSHWSFGFRLAKNRTALGLGPPGASQDVS